jgi:hypothetical protein
MKTKKSKTVDRRRVQKFILPLLRIGGRLSNIAFNSKQRTDVPEDIRLSCTRVQQEWDEAKTRVPRWVWAEL